MGLNLGAQLFWQFETHPDLKARTAHILTYPQYWGYKLTGNMATDVTSLGCHTDLWNPWEGRFSSLVEHLDIAEKIAKPRRPFDILGTISQHVADETGLPTKTPVSCGIHDSNASLLPYLHGQEGPFAVVSTGTWVIAMSVGGDRIALDPERDTLVNVNAFGEPVPSARFMGGREYEIIREGMTITSSQADRQAVLESGVMLLPAVEPNSGPFQGKTASFTRAPENDGQRMIALSYYLALMTDTCLTLAGAKGPIIVEGPFAGNGDYCAMLAALRPDGIKLAKSATGTSVGSALLFLSHGHPPKTTWVEMTEPETLLEYARKWRQLVN